MRKQTKQKPKFKINDRVLQTGTYSGIVQKVKKQPDGSFEYFVDFGDYSGWWCFEYALELDKT